MKQEAATAMMTGASAILKVVNMTYTVNGPKIACHTLVTNASGSSVGEVHSGFSSTCTGCYSY
jgi:hypothetical protein